MIHAACPAYVRQLPLLPWGSPATIAQAPELFRSPRRRVTFIRFLSAHLAAINVRFWVIQSRRDEDVMPLL